MTTLKITIDSDKNALLLRQMLESVKFVKKIEADKTSVKKTSDHNQYIKLKAILDSVGGNMLFKNLNPVEWQKKLRDEWE